MLIFFILLVLLGVAVPGTMYVIPSSPMRKSIDAKRARKARIELDAGLSWIAKKILKKNDELAPEHQVENLRRIVKALDIKHTVPEANEHFRTFEGRRSIEDHRCHGRCPMGRYKDIWDGMVRVQEAIATQKHIVAVEAVADDIKAADHVVEHLEQEAKFIGDTTLAITTGY